MNVPELHGKRVAVVTPTLGRQGGTEVYLERLLRVQSQLGIESRVFTTAPSTGERLSDSGRAARITAAVGDDFDWLEFHHAVPRKLVATLARRLPSLLFLHTARLTCPAIGRYLPRSGLACRRPPGVGCWLSHRREGCLAPAPHPFAPFVQRRSARRMVAPVSRVVFNSEALRRLFEATITPLGRRGLVLPPPHPFPKIETSTPRAATLLYIGRLFREKGVLDALEVAARLPGTPLHLYGAGRGEGEARRLAERLGVEAHFHGHHDDATIAAALAGGGCLLLPTRFFEAWAMVGPEAIAQGCPVVAYDSGGIGEWLDPEFGECAQPGDIEALADAARRQLARATTGMIHHTAWRQVAEVRWGMEAYARRYATVVRGLLDSREAPPRG